MSSTISLPFSGFSGRLLSGVKCVNFIGFLRGEREKKSDHLNGWLPTWLRSQRCKTKVTVSPQEKDYWIKIVGVNITTSTWQIGAARKRFKKNLTCPSGKQRRWTSSLPRGRCRRPGFPRRTSSWARSPWRSPRSCPPWSCTAAG